MMKVILLNIVKTRSYLSTILIIFFTLTFIALTFHKVIIPSFKQQIINNILDETRRVASHLARSIDFDHQNTEQISDHVENEMTTFQIHKIHYFDRIGRIIYSSDTQKIGNINDNSYFHDTVAKGETYFNIKQAGEKSSEGELIFKDIIEIYIPIMRDKTFAGAFELYYDISQEIADFNHVAANLSRIVLFVFSFIFLLVLLSIYFASRRNLQIQCYQKELQALAERDHLTQVYNRRYFYTYANHLLESNRHPVSDISMCMLDADDFKKINDTYGHQAGDIALKVLCRTLNSLLRKTDLIARYGGEEFIILLPATNRENGQVIAEKIRHCIAALEIPFDEHIIKMTVSIGVSQYQCGQSLDEFVHCADTALYRSKNNGKNQVTLNGCLKKVS